MLLFFSHRVNTIRMTELLIALNTEHCDSGRTTRARLAAIAHPRNKDWKATLNLLTANKRLRKEAAKLNRQVATLQYWKKRQVTLIPNPQQPNPLLNVISSLTASIQASIKVFTDGSTKARTTKPN